MGEVQPALRPPPSEHFAPVDRPLACEEAMLALALPLGRLVLLALGVVSHLQHGSERGGKCRRNEAEARHEGGQRPQEGRGRGGGREDWAERRVGRGEGN